MASLNLNWPGQGITTQTANEWYGPTPDGQGSGPLAQFPAAEVRDAIDRHRRNITPGRDGLPIGRWLPTLADILAAIDTNWRERSAERRELETRRARAARNAQGGVPMPPETKEAVRLLEASMQPPGTPGHLDLAVARTRIFGLAEQLAARVDREKTGQLA